MIYIGIDTGVHTGIAIWDNRKRSLEMVKQMPIHRAMAVVQSYADMQKTGVGDKIIVRVEDPRQRAWFGTERMTREEERKMLQFGKITLPNLVLSLKWLLLNGI